MAGPANLADAVTAHFRDPSIPTPEKRTENEGPDAPQISSAELTTLVQTLEKQLNAADFHRLASALAAKAQQIGASSLEEAATRRYRQAPGGPR